MDASHLPIIDGRGLKVDPAGRRHHSAQGGRRWVFPGKRSDLDPPQPEGYPGRKAHTRDEARVVLIPSGPAGIILHEQAEYRLYPCSQRTPNRLISPFQDGDLTKMEASI